MTARVTALVQKAPATIYRTGDTALNVLPYVPGRIRNATPDELAALPGPAWMILPTEQADAWWRAGAKLRAVMPVGDAEQWRLFRLDQ